MATFNNSGAYSILNTQKGIYYVQGGHYFSPTTFVDLGTTAPTDYQSLSSERSDQVSITGGALDGVTVGPNSTINAAVSGSVTNATITGSTISGSSIDGTPIGQSTPAAGAFTGLNATSANILGPLSAEQGISATTNAQPAGVTNTGVSLSSSSTWASATFYDSTRSANNKTVDAVWQTGAFSLRFKNDAGSTAVPFLSAVGGAASGITSITFGTAANVPFLWAGTGPWTVGGSTGTTGQVFTSQGNALNPAWSSSIGVSGTVDAGGGLRVKEGANAKQGIATLVAGTVTVANTSVTANSRIFLTVQSLGTVTDPKAVGVTARTAGTSFVIKSADATDTSVIAYEIFEPGT